LFFKDDESDPIFEDLGNLKKIDISNNILSNIDDIQKIKNLSFLNISFNNIYDITFIENLKHLEYLYACNNKITSFTSLADLKKLKVLEIQNNQINYKTSSLRTLTALKSLKDLRIETNPFLTEYIKGYKYFFINQFTNLDKLDGEEINDLEREIAAEYINQYYFETNLQRPKSASNKMDNASNIKSVTEEGTKEKRK